MQVQNTTKHTILTNEITSLPDAWSIGQEQGVTHFWVMPGSPVDMAGQTFLDCGPGYKVFINSTADVQPKGASVQKIGERGHEVYMMYPHRLAFPWIIETPLDVLDTVKLLEEKLGVTCQWSPGHMGKELLKKQWTGKDQVLWDTTEDLRVYPFSESAFSLSFRRDLEPSMIGMYIHHYDKNSDFLSACRGVKTGIGSPIHIFDGDDNTHIVPGLPGIYRVTCSSHPFSTFDGVMLPEIIEEGQQWVTNDVLLYAQQKGYELRIHEAIVWPDYTKVLDTWALTLWNARQALKEVNDNAYESIKEIAKVTVGSFNTNQERHPSNRFIHPQWWSDIVGKSRVNMLCNIEKFSKEASPPVCIEVDGLYYASRDSNPRTAVPGVLDRVGQLGGYKHTASFQLTQELYEQSQGLSVGKLADLFKRAGGEKGLTPEQEQELEYQSQESPESRRNGYGASW